MREFYPVLTAEVIYNSSSISLRTSAASLYFECQHLLMILPRILRMSCVAQPESHCLHFFLRGLVGTPQPVPDGNGYCYGSILCRRRHLHSNRKFLLPEHRRIPTTASTFTAVLRTPHRIHPVRLLFCARLLGWPSPATRLFPSHSGNSL